MISLINEISEDIQGYKGINSYGIQKLFSICNKESKTMAF